MSPDVSLKSVAVCLRYVATAQSSLHRREPVDSILAFCPLRPAAIINYMPRTWAKKHNAAKFPFPDIFKHSKTTTNPPRVGRSQDLHQLLSFACFWWEGSVWSAATLKAGGRVPPSQTPVSVKCARWLNHHLAEGNQFLPENIWQPCSAAPSKLDNRDRVVPDDFMLVEPEERSQSAARRAKAQLATKCSNTEILMVLFFESWLLPARKRATHFK